MLKWPRATAIGLRRAFARFSHEKLFVLEDGDDVWIDIAEAIPIGPRADPGGEVDEVVSKLLTLVDRALIARVIFEKSPD